MTEMTSFRTAGSDMPLTSPSDGVVGVVEPAAKPDVVVPPVPPVAVPPFRRSRRPVPVDWSSLLARHPAGHRTGRPPRSARCPACGTGASGSSGRSRSGDTLERRRFAREGLRACRSPCRRDHAVHACRDGPGRHERVIGDVVEGPGRRTGWWSGRWSLADRPVPRGSGATCARPCRLSPPVPPVPPVLDADSDTDRSRERRSHRNDGRLGHELGDDSGDRRAVAVIGVGQSLTGRVPVPPVPPSRRRHRRPCRWSCPCRHRAGCDVQLPRPPVKTFVPGATRPRNGAELASTPVSTTATALPWPS